MLYWLIPYLVAYNASNSGEWKYGPEHVFKAEICNNVTLPTGSDHAFSDIKLEFSCRPMNSSLIQCRVNSGTLEKYKLVAGSSVKTNEEHVKELGLENTVFQVAFNENGMSRVWFPNSKGKHIENEIRAIIGTMHWGTKLVEKKFEDHVSLENSIIGTCQTQFNIRKKSLPDNGEIKETLLQQYNFVVPSLTERMHDDILVIDKNRDVNNCEKKTPYLYGDNQFPVEGLDGKDLKVETLNTYSQSRMCLGRKSFSAYTENLGATLYSREGKPDKTEIKAGELIRVSLQSIRPAKAELWSSDKLTKVGAGFEPGTPWSERNVETKVKFFM